MGQHWMWHAAEKESPRIFETGDLAAAEKAGWVDTPDKLKKPEPADVLPAEGPVEAPRKRKAKP